MLESSEVQKKLGTDQQDGVFQMTHTSAMLAALDPISAGADELFDLGLKYCLGQGVDANLVEAHKWFNISALKGSEAAKAYRRELSQEMTSTQVAEAQRLARALITLH